MEWDEQQLEAINACCDVNNKIVCVSGPAGTGKTQLIKEVGQRLVAAGYNFQASAPTGKAAKRIREATGFQAMTNHRMLGYGMPLEFEEVDKKTGKKKVVKVSTGAQFDRNNPLPYDVVACDEYMMVNTVIHRELIDAMKRGARLLVFGDENQLKPIEEGVKFNEAGPPAPFLAMLDNPHFRGIRLIQIHRTGEGSTIAKNAAGILSGRMPTRADDFNITFTNPTGDKTPVNVLRDYVLESLDNDINYGGVEAQIITPQRKSWTGVTALNALLHGIFWNREQPFIDLPRRKEWGEDAKKQADTLRIQVGTKVIFRANIYDLGDGGSVFNGEVGLVAGIDHEMGIIDIDFGDRICSIPPLVISEDGSKEFDPRMSIELAYALTTHQMQGSECAHITVMLNKSMSYMQNRRNFYTAVSRARRFCHVITDQMSMMRSLRHPG